MQSIKVSINPIRKFSMVASRAAPKFKYYQSFVTKLHKKIVECIYENTAHNMINDLNYVSWSGK